jgi:hypothetical protein
VPRKTFEEKIKELRKQEKADRQNLIKGVEGIIGAWDEANLGEPKPSFARMRGGFVLECKGIPPLSVSLKGCWIVLHSEEGDSKLSKRLDFGSCYNFEGLYYYNVSDVADGSWRMIPPKDFIVGVIKTAQGQSPPEIEKSCRG